MSTVRAKGPKLRLDARVSALTAGYLLARAPVLLAHPPRSRSTPWARGEAPRGSKGRTWLFTRPGAASEGRGSRTHGSGRQAGLPGKELMESHLKSPTAIFL